MNQTVLFFVGIAMAGICFISFMGVSPGFTPDQFGAKNNSVNYGIMFIGFALAGLFGPMIMVSLLNATGAYQVAFLMAVALSLVGVILTFVHRLVHKKKEEQAK